MTRIDRDDMMRGASVAQAKAIDVAEPPVHDARALTGPGPTAHIHLDGQTYTLRITRGGKLILTK